MNESTLKSLISIEFFLFFLRQFSQLHALLEPPRLLIFEEFSHLHDYIYIFAGCSTINVNLRNEILNTFAFLNGNYQSATQVNGKPSWKNDVYAIWYIQSDNKWLIGELSDIGKNVAWIFAFNDFSGITDNKNKWYYADGNAWYSPYYSSDIQIACMVNISARDLFRSA